MQAQILLGRWCHWSNDWQACGDFHLVNGLLSRMKKRLIFLNWLDAYPQVMNGDSDAGCAVPLGGSLTSWIRKGINPVAPEMAWRLQFLFEPSTN